LVIRYGFVTNQPPVVIRGRTSTNSRVWRICQTTDLPPDVPHPAGATHVADWYDVDGPDAARCFTGSEWAVDRGQHSPDLLVQIDGTQYRDGKAVRFISVMEGQYERLTELSGARARQLARALIAAADEVDRWMAHDVGDRS
jgi:hypothetical protein